MSERVPPYSESAEAGLLGCLLMDPLRACSVMRGQYGLTPADFYVPAHVTVASLVLTMADAAERIDLLTVAQRLADNGSLDAVGGDVFLQGLLDRTPTVENVAAYAEIVKQKAIARGLIRAGQEIVEEAYRTPDPDGLLKKAPDAFRGIVEVKEERKTTAAELDEIVDEWVEARKHKRPAINLYMPWDALTSMMQGLEVGLTVLAARPSAGKTTLEGIIAAHQCKTGIPVARATADSSKKQLLQRHLCCEAGVSMKKLKFGFARNDQIEGVREAGKNVRRWPMWINDWDVEITAICRWARMMHATHGIRLLTVDYLQQLRASHLGGYAANDPVTKATVISGMLKALAFELKIPVLVLSQLSREVEKENRTPRLSDLRDSGAIEQDASKVLFLYVDTKKKKRMDAAVVDATKHKRPVWFSLLKNKDGETGDLPMWMLAPYFKFVPALPKSDGGEYDPFGDDGLPADAKIIEEEWHSDPALIPDDEEVVA